MKSRNSKNYGENKQARPQHDDRCHTIYRSMKTRSMAGIIKTKTSFNLFTSTTPSPLPRNPKEALNDPQWKHAMTHEFNVLIENKTRELVRLYLVSLICILFVQCGFLDIIEF